MQQFKVSYFQRKPRERNFSVENYFHTIRQELPAAVERKVWISTYPSSGLLKRLYNTVEAAFRQGDINHVTGDIHYVASFLDRRKTVMTILDCGRLKVLEGMKFKVFRYFWYTLPARKSRYITTISQATKDDLLKYIDYPPEDIIVVPVCISPKFVRQNKEFNKEKPRILQLGTAYNKNLERLAEALKGISCELVIIGRVPAPVKEKLVKNNIDHVLFEAALSEDEIIEEYRKADIITLISTLEGFGMPIVEGNATGRVVITANVTSMPEVAGDAAHLVDPFSVEDIRRGFRLIIEDHSYRSSLIRNGFENAKRFSKEMIAGQFLDIYSGLLRQKK